MTDDLVQAQLFLIEAYSKIDKKLTTREKALLLGLTIRGMPLAQVASDISMIAKKLTNEEAVLIYRIRYPDCPPNKAVDPLIQQLLTGENVSDDRRWITRIRLLLEILPPREQKLILDSAPYK